MVESIPGAHSIMDKIETQTKTRSFRDIYHGWWTVLATAIVSAWAYGTWGYGFGAYFEPLQQEFGWTRAEISAAYSLNKLEGGLEGPWGGVITDKFGPRLISVIGNFFAGLGLILMYFMNNLWQYILIWGLIVSMGFNLGTIDPLEKALSDWFVKKRGIALGLGRVGLALGGTFGPPIMTLLLFGYGWRTAFLIAGVFTWIICIPTCWFLVKPHRPEYYGLLPDGDKPKEAKASLISEGQEYALGVGEVEFTLRQAIKTKERSLQLFLGCHRRTSNSSSYRHGSQSRCCSIYTRINGPHERSRQNYWRLSKRPTKHRKDEVYTNLWVRAPSSGHDYFDKCHKYCYGLRVYSFNRFWGRYWLDLSGSPTS
jgi:hypothetical protein